MARLNRPSIFVYGGTILPGLHKGKKIDIVSVFEAVGKNANKQISNRELEDIEKKRYQGRDRAEVCIPLILWHLQLKQWALV